MASGIIEILKDYIVKFGTDADVMLMVLLAVGSLADSGYYLTCTYNHSVRAAV